MSQINGVYGFMYKSLYRRVNKRVLLKKTVDRIIYSANSVIIQSKDNETFSADYALCTLSTGVLASDRRLKGKGKGILGARETRGVREKGGKETPFPSLPPRASRPPCFSRA